MVGETKVTITDMHVEAGKVEQFARAIRNDDPIHRDESVARERGFERIPAPRTFINTSQSPRFRPGDADTNHVEHLNREFNLGFDLHRVVRGEEHLEFERPIYVGDTLTGTTTLEDVYERESKHSGIMTFVKFKIEYTDQQGDIVATQWLTQIETTETVT